VCVWSDQRVEFWCVFPIVQKLEKLSENSSFLIKGKRVHTPTQLEAPQMAETSFDGR